MGKIVIVSDIHYEQGNFHGIDESKAINWILNVLGKTSPTDLIGLGDWGYAWTSDDWEVITSLVKVHTIFGNHDDVALLSNVKNADKSHILARDAEVRNISGLKFGFINGIVTEKGGINKGIPRNNPDQYLAMANKLKSVDFLCTHESPLMPDLWVKPVGPGPLTAQMAIEITRPAISLSGHLHGRVITKQIGKTMAIRIDSSQAQRQFVTIETQKKMITIWLEDHLLQQLIF